MKRKKETGAAIFLFALLLGLGTAFTSYGTNADMESAKKKVTALEEEKKRMEDTISQLEGLKSDAAAYVRQLDASLEALAQMG